MNEGPSLLSLAGSGIYLVVAALCCSAWSRRRGVAAKGKAWILLAIFFVVLAASRWLMLEELARTGLRALAQSVDLYSSRHTWQLPMTILALLGTGMAAVLVATYLRSTSGLRHNWWARTATLAAIAMIGLIGIRIISMHAIDGLLYGGIHLNWVLDIGLTLVVGIAAWQDRVRRDQTE